MNFLERTHSISTGYININNEIEWVLFGKFIPSNIYLIKIAQMLQQNICAIQTMQTLNYLPFGWIVKLRNTFQNWIEYCSLLNKESNKLQSQCIEDKNLTHLTKHNWQILSIEHLNLISHSKRCGSALLQLVRSSVCFLKQGSDKPIQTHQNIWKFIIVMVTGGSNRFKWWLRTFRSDSLLGIHALKLLLHDRVKIG